MLGRQGGKVLENGVLEYESRRGGWLRMDEGEVLQVRARADGGAPVDDDVAFQLHVLTERNTRTDDAVGADFNILSDFGAGGDDSGGVDRVALGIPNLLVRKKRACFHAGFGEFPLTINIEAEAREMTVRPLVGPDHRESVFAPNAVEVVGLADNRLEIDLGFVNELVPVEVLDGGDVLLADFHQLLLEIAFDLADATGLEGGEIGGNDAWTQGGNRIGEERSLVHDVLSVEFFYHHCQ